MTTVTPGCTHADSWQINDLPPPVGRQTNTSDFSETITNYKLFVKHFSKIGNQHLFVEECKWMGDGRRIDHQHSTATSPRFLLLFILSCVFPRIGLTYSCISLSSTKRFSSIIFQHIQTDYAKFQSIYGCLTFNSAQNSFFLQIAFESGMTERVSQGIENTIGHLFTTATRFIHFNLFFSLSVFSFAPEKVDVQAALVRFGCSYNYCNEVKIQNKTASRMIAAANIMRTLYIGEQVNKNWQYSRLRNQPDASFRNFCPRINFKSLETVPKAEV